MGSSYGQLFAKVDARGSVDEMIGAVNAQFPGGKYVFTDDDVKEYIEKHAMETLGKPRVDVEKAMRAGWKPAVEALVKAKFAQGARASDDRARAGQSRKAAAILARHRSPEGIMRKARLERNTARCAALGHSTPKTFEERRERYELGAEIIADQSWLASAPGFR